MNGATKRAAERRKAWLRTKHKRNPRCAYCLRVTDLAKSGAKGPMCATVDHYEPLARGGTDEPCNWRLSCRQCNEIKADLAPAEFWEALEAA